MELYYSKYYRETASLNNWLLSFIDDSILFLSLLCFFIFIDDVGCGLLDGCRTCRIRSASTRDIMEFLSDASITNIK
jgi:hypothetical protein